MSLTNDVIAILSSALVFPAILFVSALFARQVAPRTGELARAAERIVQWFSNHSQVGLWLLLLLFPATAFVLGSSALLRTWAENPMLQYYSRRAIELVPEHLAAILVAGATLASGFVLALTARQLLRA